MGSVFNLEELDKQPAEDTAAESRRRGLSNVNIPVRV
jgi:hypothetical protein